MSLAMNKYIQTCVHSGNKGAESRVAEKRVAEKRVAEKRVAERRVAQGRVAGTIVAKSSSSLVLSSCTA